jgi:hypothetical protein
VTARDAPAASADVLEQTMLGAMMAGATGDVLAAGVQAGHLAETAHRLVFAALAALHAAGERADAMGAFAYLHDRGQAEAAGGIEYVNELALGVIGAGEALPAAKAVMREAARRELASVGRAAEAGGDPAALAQRARAAADGLEQQQHRRAPFDVVAVADLKENPPEAPSFWWEPYIPADVVTLLSAHGGTGKSTIGLQIGVAIGTGRPLFGMPTCGSRERGRVLFFSAEDGAELVRHRLQTVCRAMGVEPETLAGWLHLLDASGGDPVLYHEVTAAQVRAGCTTRTYAALRDYMLAHDIDVLIIDNASDAFDANEIARAAVRGFMRALATLARPHRAVLLLAHVDKGTSRGDRAGSEGYSGSTAWHNSARSRLYLSRGKDGSLLLEHQKYNLTQMRDPLRLEWPHDGVPQVEAPPNGMVQQITQGNELRAVLRLIHEYGERGEHVTTATTSRTHAGKLLRTAPTFPARLTDARVFEMLRDAARRGWLESVTIRTEGRKHKDCWSVTPAGCEAAGIAPTAPTAPTSAVGAQGAVSAEAAPTAPTSARGVWGEERAHKSARADDGSGVRDVR